jgi:hypothetical protein
MKGQLVGALGQLVAVLAGLRRGKGLEGKIEGQERTLADQIRLVQSLRQQILLLTDEDETTSSSSSTNPTNRLAWAKVDLLLATIITLLHSSEEPPPPSPSAPLDPFHDDNIASSSHHSDLPPEYQGDAFNPARSRNVSGDTTYSYLTSSAHDDPPTSLPLYSQQCRYSLESTSTLAAEADHKQPLLPRPSSHQTLPTSSSFRSEKLRLDLDAVTSAIDRLNAVAPQLASQRAVPRALTPAELEEIEVARMVGRGKMLDQTAAASPALLLQQQRQRNADEMGKGKMNPLKEKELGEIWDRIEKAHGTRLAKQEALMRPEWEQEKVSLNHFTLSTRPSTHAACTQLTCPFSLPSIEPLPFAEGGLPE